MLARLLPWILCLACATGGAAAAWRLSSRAEDERRARQDVEARALAAEGLAVVHSSTAADLAHQLEVVSQGNASLAAEVERLRRTARRTRVVRVTRASTGSVAATGSPRLEPAPQPRACLLSLGDTGEVRVVEAVLETGAGNRVLVGTAEAWRLTPAPATALISGQFRAELTESLEEPVPPAGWPTWALGVAAAAGGLLVGGVAAVVR